MRMSASALVSRSFRVINVRECCAGTLLAGVMLNPCPSAVLSCVQLGCAGVWYFMQGGRSRSPQSGRQGRTTVSAPHLYCSLRQESVPMSGRRPGHPLYSGKGYKEKG